jgi:hypothetical protein
MAAPDKKTMIMPRSKYCSLLGGIGIAIVLLGKVKRTFWLGVRTPWTLASDRARCATHRLAGKSMVTGGLIVLAATLAGLPGMSRPPRWLRRRWCRWCFRWCITSVWNVAAAPERVGTGCPPYLETGRALASHV